MNRMGMDQVAEAVGGRIVGPPQAAQQTITGISTDTRTIRPDELFVALPGERFDGHDFVAAAIAAGAAGAIVSRPTEPPAAPGGRPVGLILVRDTLAALGRLAAWYRQRLPASVVAVTGSNGKTTTRAMIAHILAKDRQVVESPKSFNNAIGLPLTLLSADSADNVIVCEIGSNGPGEVEALGRIAQPNIAVIVSIAETHLEKLRSLEGVAAEKASLLGALAPGGVGIINGDRAPLAAAARGYSCNLIRFGNDPRGEMVLGGVVTTAAGIRFTVNGTERVSLPLLGRHNAINALAAITVARRLGLSVRESADRLADFALPPMRLELVKAGGVQFINDAYNANPASMAAALEAFGDYPWRKGRRTFICGDMRELGSQSEAFHAQLGQRIAAAGVGRLLAVGEHAAAVAEGARQAGMDAAQTAVFKDTAALLRDLRDKGGPVSPGDLVLVKGSRALGLERVIDIFQAKKPGPLKKGPQRVAKREIPRRAPADESGSQPPAE